METTPTTDDTPSLESVFDQLRNYANNNDAKFRAGKTLATETNWHQKDAPNFPETPDEQSDDELFTTEEEPLYNVSTITFEARRKSYDKKAPLTFIIGFTALTQLTEIPHTLRDFLSDDMNEMYANPEPGELHEVQSVEYTLEIGDYEPFEATRNISYALETDTMQVIHFTEEHEVTRLDEHASTTYEAPDPNENPTLRRKQHPDQIQQTGFNREFSDISDGVGNTELFDQIVALRNAEAAVCIKALLTSLKERNDMPDIINKLPEVYPKEKSYPRQ